MIDIDTLEALVGPLPKGQALKQSLEEIKSVTNDIALLMLRLTELPPKIDAALNEAYERLKQQAADLAEARFFAEGWHKQFRRVNRARHEEKARAERAEIEVWKLRQLLAICDACHEPIKAVPRSQTSVAQTARDANLAAADKCWHEAEAEARKWERKYNTALLALADSMTCPRVHNESDCPRAKGGGNCVSCWEQALARHDAGHGGK